MANSGCYICTDCGKVLEQFPKGQNDTDRARDFISTYFSPMMGKTFTSRYTAIGSTASVAIIDGIPTLTCIFDGETYKANLATYGSAPYINAGHAFDITLKNADQSKSLDFIFNGCFTSNGKLNTIWTVQPDNGGYLVLDYVEN